MVTTDSVQDIALDLRNLNVWYDQFHAVKNVSIPIGRHQIFALIGPSGCGKSTLLRTINRMTDFVDKVKVSGSITFDQHNTLDPGRNPIDTRRRIGMVFQKPNPFPTSILRNITWGPSINGYQGNLNKLAQRSLERAALWDEVKDKLQQSGLALSGGQQQRLCIARAIALEPEVLLMDEPCSALDPRSTSLIEKLLLELRKFYTIVIVTHNMQQALRISDHTGFMFQGELVESGETKQIFESPSHKLTQDYLAGRFG